MLKILVRPGDEAQGEIRVTVARRRQWIVPGYVASVVSALSILTYIKVNERNRRLLASVNILKHYQYTDVHVRGAFISGSLDLLGAAIC